MKKTKLLIALLTGSVALGSVLAGWNQVDLTESSQANLLAQSTVRSIDEVPKSIGEAYDSYNQFKMTMSVPREAYIGEALVVKVEVKPTDIASTYNSGIYPISQSDTVSVLEEQVGRRLGIQGAITLDRGNSLEGPDFIDAPSSNRRRIYSYSNFSNNVYDYTVEYVCKSSGISAIKYDGFLSYTAQFDRITSGLLARSFQRDIKRPITTEVTVLCKDPQDEEIVIEDISQEELVTLTANPVTALVGESIDVLARVNIPRDTVNFWSLNDIFFKRSQGISIYPINPVKHIDRGAIISDSVNIVPAMVYYCTKEGSSEIEFSGHISSVRNNRLLNSGEIDVKKTIEVHCAENIVDQETIESGIIENSASQGLRDSGSTGSDSSTRILQKDVVLSPEVQQRKALLEAMYIFIPGFNGVLSLPPEVLDEIIERFINRAINNPNEGIMDTVGFSVIFDPTITSSYSYTINPGAVSLADIEKSLEAAEYFHDEVNAILSTNLKNDIDKRSINRAFRKIKRLKTEIAEANSEESAGRSADLPSALTITENISPENASTEKTRIIKPAGTTFTDEDTSEDDFLTERNSAEAIEEVFTSGTRINAQIEDLPITISMAEEIKNYADDSSASIGELLKTLPTLKISESIGEETYPIVAGGALSSEFINSLSSGNLAIMAGVVNTIINENTTIENRALFDPSFIIGFYKEEGYESTGAIVDYGMTKSFLDQENMEITPVSVSKKCKCLPSGDIVDCPDNLDEEGNIVESTDTQFNADIKYTW